MRSTASKTCNLMDNLSIGEEIRMVTLAKEWLDNHQCIRPWINGEYVNYEPGYKSVPFIYKMECQGIQIDVSVDDGSPFIDNSIKSCLECKYHDPRDGFYNMGLKLESKKQLLSQLNYFTRQENEIDLFIDCFKFYSSAAIPADFDAMSQRNKTVLIVINESTPDWILGASVAGALLAGCSVIINPNFMTSSLPYIPFLLAEISENVGLPAGLINVVPGSVETTKEFLSRNFGKVVFYGDIHDRISMGSIKPNVNFSNLTLGHTVFIILNNCDLDGPARKLLSMFKNWDNAKCWKSDLIVIEESILTSFLVRLFEICFPDTTAEANYFREEIVKEGDIGLISGINVGKLISAIDMKERNIQFKDMGGIPFEIIMKKDKVLLKPTSENKVIDISVCRTGHEALGLLSNFPYCFGTSIWTENITEAIELALELESTSVWINCHGIADPCVSFEPSRLSGTGSFGGLEGFLNFAELHCGFSNDGLRDGANSERKKDEFAEDKTIVFKTIQTAVEGFNKWKKETDKAKYLKAVKNVKILNEWGKNTKPLNYSFNPSTFDLHAIQVKKPIGVILIVIDDWIRPEEKLTSLVSPAIVFGNAVIVVASENNVRKCREILNRYFGHFPRGVLNVLEGIDSAIDVGKDPNVKAIWFSTPYEKSSHFVKTIREALAEERRNFWCRESIDHSLVFYKQCLKKQTIWLPIIHSLKY